MPSVRTDSASDKLTDPTRVLIRRIVIALILVGCGIGMAVAVQHTRRGDDTVRFLGGEPRPNVVRLVSPADGSNVLSQAQIEIDLDTLYDANLVVNDTSIPSDQLIRHPEINQVLFSPGPGKVIEKYPAGTNCVVANIFRVDGSEDPQAPVRWCFQVT
jgi:hypothetical protein